MDETSFTLSYLIINNTLLKYEIEMQCAHTFHYTIPFYAL